MARDADGRSHPIAKIEPRTTEALPPGGRSGVITGLEYDEDGGLFRGWVRTTAGQLAATIPMDLVPEWRSVRLMASGVPGWLTESEMHELFTLAQAVQQPNVIVEIGSYKGKSTVCLGWGSRLGQSVYVYAVDHHNGSPEHQRAVATAFLGTLPHFRMTVTKAGLDELVKELVQFSVTAVDQVAEPIGLLFIDGHHDEVRQDFDAWYPKVAPGGKIAFHDYVPGWPAVQEAVDRILTFAWVQRERQVGSMLVCRKPALSPERTGTLGE